MLSSIAKFFTPKHERQQKYLLPPSELLEYYLELRRVRRKKISELEAEKQSMRNLSNMLIDMKLMSGRLLTESHSIKLKLYNMLREETSSEAGEKVCVGLQSCLYDLESMFSRLRKLREMVEPVMVIKYKVIEISEAHIWKIDKALLSIEADMRVQLEPKKKGYKVSLNLMMKNRLNKIKVAPVYFKTSVSKCSFTSNNTAFSSDSTCLGAMLLKKWLTPLVEATS